MIICEESVEAQHLVQYIFVEVGHVAMIRHGAVIVVLEVLLQSHGVMWDLQHRVQVVRQHLTKKHVGTVSRQADTQSLSLCMILHVSTNKHTSRGKQSSGTLRVRTAWILLCHGC